MAAVKRGGEAWAWPRAESESGGDGAETRPVSCRTSPAVEQANVEEAHRELIELRKASPQISPDLARSPQISPDLAHASTASRTPQPSSAGVGGRLCPPPRPCHGAWQPSRGDEFTVAHGSAAAPRPHGCHPPTTSSATSATIRTSPTRRRRRARRHWERWSPSARPGPPGGARLAARQPSPLAPDCESRPKAQVRRARVGSLATSAASAAPLSPGYRFHHRESHG